MQVGEGRFLARALGLEQAAVAFIEGPRLPCRRRGCSQGRESLFVEEFALGEVADFDGDVVEHG